ncbi:secreted protein [Melampsora americana]|nr:secreted protein [Melampsora americana]
MMRKPFKSNLKDILLLWMISNLNFCIKSHPSFSTAGMHIADGMRMAEDSKNLGTTLRGDNVADIPQARLATSSEIQSLRTGTGDANSLGTTDIPWAEYANPTDLRSPRTSTGDANVLESSKATGKDFEGNSLKFVPEASQTQDLRAMKVIDLDPIFKNHKAFDWNVKFLKPDQVRQLDPDDLIRYMAERDSLIAKDAGNLYQQAQRFTRVEEDVFSKLTSRSQYTKQLTASDEEELAKIRLSPKEGGYATEDLRKSARMDFITKTLGSNPSGYSKQLLEGLQEARNSYDLAYSNTYNTINRLISPESFEPQILSTLSDQEYARKAALFDTDVNRKYGLWLKQEEGMDRLVKNSHSELASLFNYNKLEGYKILNNKINIISGRMKQVAALRGEPINENLINKAAAKEVIKEEATNLNLPQLKKVVLNLDYFEKGGLKAKRVAVRSADLFYRNHGILKASDLRSQPRSITKFFEGLRAKNWSLKDFFKKMFALLFRSGRDKKSATAQQPLTGDIAIGRNPTEVASNL